MSRDNSMELPSFGLTSDNAPLDEDGLSGSNIHSSSFSTGQHNGIASSPQVDLNSSRSPWVSSHYQLDTPATNNFVLIRNPAQNRYNGFESTRANSFSTGPFQNGNIVGSSVPSHSSAYAHGRSNGYATHSAQNNEVMNSNNGLITRQRYLVDANRFVNVTGFYEEPMDESVGQVPNQLDLRDERKRLDTFTGKWPPTVPSQINPSTLAKNGFYYVGPYDRVCCIFCKGVLKKWDAHDSVVDEHRKHFPKCPFVLGQEVGNIPIDNGDMVKSDSFGVLPVQNFNKPVNGSPRELPENLGIVQSKPKHPVFALETDRLATFKNWPSQIKQQPEQLAKAGLFYVGNGDKVKCFTCDGLLCQWEPEDDPWIEHARWFPDCQYVRLIKGDNFIQQVLRRETPVQEKETKTISEKEHEQNSAAIQALLEVGCKMQEVSEAIKWLHEHGGIPDDVIPKAEQIYKIILEREKSPNAEVVNEDFQNQIRRTPNNITEKEDISALMEENRELKEQKVCKICLDNEISIIFLPCGHLVCCSACASSVTECPICRAPIKGAAKAFWS